MEDHFMRDFRDSSFEIQYPVVFVLLNFYHSLQLHLSYKLMSTYSLHLSSTTFSAEEHKLMNSTLESNFMCKVMLNTLLHTISQISIFCHL